MKATASSSSLGGNMCQHCRRVGISIKCMRLCSRCYEDKGIRAKYNGTAIHGRPRPVGRSVGRCCLQPELPTNHPPGSRGKVDVLVERYARGLPLWHPLDADMSTATGMGN